MTEISPLKSYSPSSHPLQVNRLVSYVRAVLTKRRLESFEIQVTSLEEATTEILSPVVEMICDTLPELAQSLNKLVLALELDGQQVGVDRCFICISFMLFPTSVYFLF